MPAPSGRDAGFDDWLDAAARGDAFYLACPDGHGSLPPRRICPACGSRELAEDPLPAAGEVVSFTVGRVATPQFADDAPYVTAIADFGPVRVTGLLRGVEVEDAAVGLPVELGVGTTETTGDRAVVLTAR